VSDPVRTKSLHTVVLVFDEVELLDVMGPIGVITSAGRNWNFRPFKLELAAARAGAVTTASGLPLSATRDFSAGAPIEILIVPGGYGARRIADDPAHQAWLRDAFERAELVAALGNGLLPLARAGCLAGAEVAATPELGSELSASDATLRVQSADTLCTSGKLLSARGGARSLELGCEIVARAFGPKLAATVAHSLGIPWSGATQAIEIVLP
jgi:transcriptional regulator GlxA family with amidase domain